jgi:hypothetical protein
VINTKTDREKWRHAERDRERDTQRQTETDRCGRRCVLTSLASEDTAVTNAVSDLRAHRRVFGRQLCSDHTCYSGVTVVL